MIKIDDCIIIYKLFKEHKYDEIYEKYGKEIYSIITPNKIKNNEIEKLIENGDFLFIYEKYGVDIKKEHFKKIRLKDIENELGINFKFNSYVFFNDLKRKFKLICNKLTFKLCYFLYISFIIGSLISDYSDDIINENTITYQNEIEDYNNEIESYAQYINSLNLSDLEIIMKVMNDMWEKIDGYKTPNNYDINGYFRLSLYYDGYGVCRNMADDLTARLNAINPDYEACNINVLIERVEVNNIKTINLNNEEIISSNDNEIIDNNENDNVTITDNNEISYNQKIINEYNKFKNYIIELKNNLIENTIGNHMVTCIKLKNIDAILIVDPTNPSIGLFKNGKLHMLSDKENKINVTPIGNIIMGFDKRKNYFKKSIESFFINSEEYTNEYNIENQNKCLIKINNSNFMNKYNIK